jgi:hypothetical protein
MNKKVFVVVVGVVMACVMASGLIASNMGFKLNYPLTAVGAGSNSGTNVLALPFNRQSGVDTANALMNDMVLANVANVQRFLEATDTLETYTGRKGSPAVDFGLVPGEAYYVRMNAPVDYIVVGSHDPSLSVSLDAAGAGSNSGTNFFAAPYHTTSLTAFDLMNDINFASVQNVQRFLEATDTLETYTGRKGTPAGNFNLVPGEGYYVRMSSTVSYTPSHF